MHIHTSKHLDTLLDSLSRQCSRVENALRDETEPGPMANLRGELHELRYDRLLVQEFVRENEPVGIWQPIIDNNAGLPGGVVGPQYDGDTTE